MWWTLFPLCRPPGEAPGRAHHQAQLLAHAARHLPAAAAEAWNQLLTWCWELLLELLVTAEVCCQSLPLFLAVCCLSAALLFRYRWVFRHSLSSASCFLFSSGQPPTQQPHVLLLLGVYCLALGHCHDSSVLGPEPRARETRDNWQEAAQRPHISRVCCVLPWRKVTVQLYRCTTIHTQLCNLAQIMFIPHISSLTSVFVMELILCWWWMGCSRDAKTSEITRASTESLRSLCDVLQSQIRPLL